MGGRCRGLGGPCALGKDMCGAAFLPTLSPCHAEVGLPCLLISAERLVQECGLVNGGGDVDEAARQGYHRGVGVGVQRRTHGVPGLLKYPHVQSCLSAPQARAEEGGDIHMTSAVRTYTMQKN